MDLLTLDIHKRDAVAVKMRCCTLCIPVRRTYKDTTGPPPDSIPSSRFRFLLGLNLES